MNERILNALKSLHAKTGGHCGITYAGLCMLLKVNYNDIRENLIDLWNQNKITSHPSVHGKIIKINPEINNLS